MFDFGKFLCWIAGGLFEPVKTWKTYKAENHGWWNTATQFSIPLVVAAGVLSLILGWLFADSYLLDGGGGGGFTGFIFSLIMSLVWFGIGGFCASFLAGKFGGTDNYNQAWSALTFASVPGVAGSILGTLPWIGALAAFVALVWSLVLLFKALPTFLDVPAERATGHFFATLGLSMVAMLMMAAILSAVGLKMEANPDAATFTNREPDRQTIGFGRELDYLEAANNDRFSPPSDGKLSVAQVKKSLRYLAAAQRLRDASTSSLEKLSGDNQNLAFGDLFKGVKGLVSAGTAEMQSVKSAGGNWAEHEWVKKQLFEASLHQDLNASMAHNYRIYQDYEDQLKDWF